MKQVAIAILYQQGKYLLQLRDDIPDIVYPGYWAFFGGHLEANETPEVAVVRELYEEIRYRTSDVTLFDRFVFSPDVVRYVFYAPLTVTLDRLDLREGWDFALWTPDEIRLGQRYSDNARQVRAIAPPHQRILLDFLDRIAPRLG
ncbi:NUDIX hydrolase [Baaleninema simplex]|uniref:NUDIX hydrolase n=1 Tax=Baaleninema simplex TaxID=2862350 RepID=UPI00034AAEB5|nr:NUDIX hydrolase [Baaleninema simplex]